MRSWLFAVGRFLSPGLGLVASVCSCEGNDPTTTSAEDYSIECWQMEQGLPQISVISIAQTPDGYLWLGTFNGLARFDGLRFKVFNEVNTPALGSGGIVRLITDDQGVLWIMSQGGGLARMADGVFTAYGPEHGMPSCGAAALALDLTGRLVVVDRDGGCHQLEHGRLVKPGREGTGAGAESRLLVSATEPCWVEKQGRAVNASTTVPVRLLTGGGTNPPYVEFKVVCGAPSRQGGFWLGSTSGVYRVQNGCVQPRPLPFPEGLRSLVCMAEDREGKLWLGTWAGGVWRREPTGQWQRFGADSGLGENDVAAVFIDREHNVWVGTGSGGLHRFKKRVFHSYDTRDGLAGQTVTSVTEDRQGRLWIGANGGGLSCWQSGKFAPVKKPPELLQFRLVYSVLADREDGIWVGTYGGRAMRLHQAGLKLFTPEEGFVPATIRALFQDREGVIWLGSDHGLQRYEAGRLTCYTRRDGLTHDVVRAVAQDKSGALYVGTRGGLDCFRANRFRGYTTADGLPAKNVSALYVDRDDTLWIGTANGGLCRFRQDRFAGITTHDGLPSDTIGTVVEDDLGYLWLGSTRGIVRVSRRELNDYLDGRRQGLTCRVFDCSDGLNTVDCGGGGQPASCKTRDGRLWFATGKGVAVVDPAHLPLNPIPPPVVIEEVLVEDDAAIGDRGYSWLVSRGGGLVAADHRGVAAGAEPSATARTPKTGKTPGGELVIPAGKHRLDFRFTGLSLVAPERVRFRYRLKGLDDDWIEAGSQRSATYSHVPPGTYRFEVTACNNDGVWNEEGAGLGLALLPPWWSRWWFRGLAAVSVAGLIFGWYERRLHRLRRERLAQQSFSRRLIASQEEERQRLAGELHDGMGQDLLIIASQAQLSLSRESNPPGTVTRLQEIADTAKQALQQARRMAHNLRPGLLDELGLTKALRATLEKAGQASGIAMTIELADVDGLLPPEFEVNLFRIVQETLNNVIKHAGASQAKAVLTRKPGGLCLVIEDNGRGFEPGRQESAPPDQRGLGLHQISERAIMMGGRAQIESCPGQGTRLTVEVPLSGARLDASP